MPALVSELTTAILKVLQETSIPLPADEICRIVKYPSEKVGNPLDTLEGWGLVRKRPSPDDRNIQEWWLISREQEDDFKWWLSIPEKINKKTIGEIYGD